MFSLRCWRRLVLGSLLAYMRHRHGVHWWVNPTEACACDREAGAECVWRAMEADFWEWSAGSCLFFGGGLRIIVLRLEMVINPLYWELTKLQVTPAQGSKC